MKTETARTAVGAQVVYTAHLQAAPEYGVIDSGGTHRHHVMVLFEGQDTPKSTPTGRLDFRHRLSDPIKLHRASGREYSLVCEDGNCSRRHDFKIKCSCGEELWTGLLKFTKARAEAHQAGREYKP